MVVKNMANQWKKWLSSPADWLLYTLLNERQRKEIGDLFTQEQKQKIKRLIGGKQQMQRQQLKRLHHHLYSLGFTKRALAELEEFYQGATDPHIKRLAAWELALWHANRYTEEGARQALSYLPAVLRGERDKHQLRRTAIITAECFDRLNEKQHGERIIQRVQQTQEHADLYLALANLEETTEPRLQRINQAMAVYQLSPIGFNSGDAAPSYDDLITSGENKTITAGPKVSVILPAFNAGSGIRVAIESILSQTWQNIELLVVDDCSPDNTAEVAAEYAKVDSRVKLLSTPVNSGPYVARNVALKEATGDLVTINDADDWSHAEKIERQVRHLIENQHVIANTSGHARLTEDLQFYRRGTPGKYIFPNMSSIMFRRQPVMEKIGYWDSVRFAADGEFKRRLIKVFGKNAYVDLNTGPLSLPRQSVSSLTGSSAFGYNGFFMGVRREYVESLEAHHQKSGSLYYTYPQENRPFPVPEPMWPKREDRQEGGRRFDLVIAADFRKNLASEINELLNQQHANARIGIVQLYRYDLNMQAGIHPEVRRMLNRGEVQMLVYGEKIQADELLLIDPAVLDDWQKYRAEVKAKEVKVVVTDGAQAKKQAEQMQAYFGTPGVWYPASEQVRQELLELEADDAVTLAEENWVSS